MASQAVSLKPRSTRADFKLSPAKDAMNPSSSNRAATGSESADYGSTGRRRWQRFAGAVVAGVVAATG